MFVLDVSVTMAWCFQDEADAATESVLDQLQHDGAAVPAIWSLEVANVILAAERRGRITEGQATRFLDLLRQLPISVDEAATDVPAVVAVGRRHGLSSYDAAYLLLAQRLGVPLATLDRPLAEAAGRAHVPLLIHPQGSEAAPAP